VQIFIVGENGQSVEILKGVLRYIEIQTFKKCGFGRERFTSLYLDGDARRAHSDGTSWEPSSRLRTLLE
jgi:hypothetical protein